MVFFGILLKVMASPISSGLHWSLVITTQVYIFLLIGMVQGHQFSHALLGLPGLPLNLGGSLHNSVTTFHRLACPVFCGWCLGCHQLQHYLGSLRTWPCWTLSVWATKNRKWVPGRRFSRWTSASWVPWQYYIFKQKSLKWVYNFILEGLSWMR